MSVLIVLDLHMQTNAAPFSSLCHRRLCCVNCVPADFQVRLANGKLQQKSKVKVIFWLLNSGIASGQLLKTSGGVGKQ